MKNSPVSIGVDIDPVIIDLIRTVVTVGISDSIGSNIAFSGYSSIIVLNTSIFLPF